VLQTYKKKKKKLQPHILIVNKGHLVFKGTPKVVMDSTTFTGVGDAYVGLQCPNCLHTKYNGVFRFYISGIYCSQKTIYSINHFTRQLLALDIVIEFIHIVFNFTHVILIELFLCQ
jgi:hypothetical protein